MRLRSLRARLIAGLIVIGALFALINSLVQIKLDYDHALENINAELDIVSRHAINQVALALRENQAQGEEGQFAKQHSESLGNALKSIVFMPSLDRAELDIDGQLVHRAGPTEIPAKYVLRTFSVPAGVHSATLSVYAFLDTVEQSLYQRTALIILGNTLRTLIAVLFVAVFIEHILMRHLRKITRYLQSNKPELASEALSLEREEANDELDKLVGAVNQLKHDLGIYQNQLKAEKNRYLALVENNPTAIWRCEIEPPMALELSEQAQVHYLLQQAKLVECNAVAKSLMVGTPNSEEHEEQLPFIVPSLWQALVQGQGKIKDYLSETPKKAPLTRYFSSSVVMLEENFRYRTVWGITTDITDRTEAQKALEEREQELQASRERLAEAQALAHMGHWDYRSADDLLLVSAEFARIYGFDDDAQKVQWSEVYKRIHPDDVEYVIEALTNAESQAVGAEHRVVWPSGEVRNVQSLVRKQIHDTQVTATYGIIIDITEQRRAEQARHLSQQALIDSEARLAEAQALAHMGHWVMDYGKDQFTCSDEFFRLYGHEPRSFQPSLEAFNQQIHPDDQQRIQEKFADLRSTSISETFRIIRPSREIRYLRRTTTPHFSGAHNNERVFGISIDVTELIAAESALKATEALMGTAFTASPDGITFIDAKRLIFITSNPTWQRITGYDDDELRNQPLELLQMKATEPKFEQPDLRAIIAREPRVTDLESTLISKTGETVTCMISWRTVSMQGRGRKLMFARDVSQLRQLELITAQQNQQLVHADKLASLGTMVAGVAHEINNPNHTIQMNAELLEGFFQPIMALINELPEQPGQTRDFKGLSLQELSDTVPELLRDMINGCRRINRIVKDLKDFSRPRADAQYAPLDLNEVIEQSRSLLTSRVESLRASNRLDLQFDLRPVPPVQGDAQQLQQVVINLAMNAIDALASKDSGKVTIRTRLNTERQRVECAVEDNGCGIDEEHLSQIFDPFFTTKQDSGGTGLGLAISFQLLREHGGLLQADSAPGRGTIMSFCLPALDPK